MANKLLEDAMEDTRQLHETAVEHARNVLVEAISPKIKEFIDAQLGEIDMVPEMGMYEKHEDEPEDLELMKKVGLLGDEEGEDELGLELGDEFSDEDKEDMEDMEEMALEGDEVTEGEELAEEEEIEVTNEDLEAALSEVLDEMKLKEASVSKGFGDAKSVDDGGLADKKSGEKHWSDEMAPNAQDWTVKEAAYKKKLSSLVAEVNSLRSEVKQYQEAYSHLKEHLQETHLFTSKLNYTNKILNNANLNKEQKIHVVETIDSAKNLREVKLAYNSLSEALKIAGVLGEGKGTRKTLKGPKASRLVTSSSTVVTESRESQMDDHMTRMQALAGLVD